MPEVVAVLLETADRDREAGRVEEAMAGYREAMRRDPSVAEAYLGLGALYHQAGRLEDSLEVFEAGLRQRPDHSTLLFNAAVVARRLERDRKALSHIERALAVSEPQPELHLLRASLLTTLARPEEALESLRRAADLAPGDGSLHFRIGNLYHQLGRNEEAIAAFEVATAVEPGLLRAYYNLGAVLFEEGRHREALEAYNIGLRPIEDAFTAGEVVDPIHAQAYLNLGGIRLQLGDLPEALAAYERALRLRPGSPRVLYNLGFVHFVLGNVVASEEAYRAALEEESSLPLAYLHLGVLARDRSLEEEAIVWLESGMPYYDAGSRRSALLELAQARRALGRLEEGVAEMETVLAEHPEDVAARVLLARMLRQLGDVDGAQRALAGAGREGPHSAAVDLELAALARAAGDADALLEHYRAALGRLEEPSLRQAIVLDMALHLLERGAAREAADLLASVGRAEVPQEIDGPDLWSEWALLRGLALAASGDRSAARPLLEEVGRHGAAGATAAHALGVLTALDGDLEAAEAALGEVSGMLDPSSRPVARGHRALILWLLARGTEADEEVEGAPADGVSWVARAVIRGEAALGRSDSSAALSWLDQAHDRCGRGEQRLRPAGGEPWIWVGLGWSDAPSAALCRHVAALLGAASLTRSLAALEGAADGGAGAIAAAAAAGRALELPLEPAQRALALLLRGTARLREGSPAAARDDLVRALEGPLDAEARAVAHNNLAVALWGVGDQAAARRELEAARTVAGPGGAEATLNLAILLDDYLGDARAALALYREYARRGEGRRGEVEEAISRLERVYP